MGKMVTNEKYSNYSGRTAQNTDTANRQIGTDKFIPKGKGAPAGAPAGTGPKYTSEWKKKGNPMNTVTTDRAKPQMRNPWASGGNGTMKSESFTKSGKAPFTAKAARDTTKSSGTDQFIPGKTVKVA